MGSLLLSLGPVHNNFVRAPENGVPVSSNPRSSVIKLSLGFKVRGSGEFIALSSDPQAGESDVGLRTFTNFFGIIFPACELPIHQEWDLILS